MSLVAFVFPGQGAQAVGMGRAFYDAYAESRDLYKRANRAVGYDLAALCFEGPPQELTRTERCQPALFVTSLAAVAAVHTVAPATKPVAVAGLSLGEFTALAAVDAISFKDGLYLVQGRADAMAECAAHHQGAMLAVVGLSNQDVESVCASSGAVGANYNAPEQVVLSGQVSAIERAEQLAKDKGAKRVVRLEVAGAFHSPLMQPAADILRHALEKIRIQKPQAPVVTNVTGQPVTDPDEIRHLLLRQLVSPVLWEHSMRTVISLGATHVVEFPPARVLTSLLRRIDKTIKGLAIDEPKDLAGLAEVLTEE